MVIRKEQKKDFKAVESAIKEAFYTAEHTSNDEHNLVAKLRKSNAFIRELSLIAEIDDKVVGHILLTKLCIINESETFPSLALAPLAVLPKFQKKSIGSLLVKEAIKIAKEMGFGSIVVVGYPEYYTKFGFIQAANYNIKAPFPVPDEAFMILELSKDALQSVSGTVEYPKEFGV